VHDIVQKGTNR